MAAVTSEKPAVPAAGGSWFTTNVPPFSDIGKTANDLINKDFYHVAQANLEVKLKTPQGPTLLLKGKQDFNGVTAGSLEGKGVLSPGITLTQLYSNQALLDTKVELTDVVANCTKVDLQNIMSPSEKVPTTQKLVLAYKQGNTQSGVHTRAFINHILSDGSIDAAVDAAAHSNGFLIGGEAGYNVQKAAITRYSLAAGYQTANYSASINAFQNLSVLAASFYQKVNPSTEVGIKTGYDVQGAKATGVEIASKYRLDPLSFAKVKMNDRGIAALAYSTKLNSGVTLGLGLSLDTAKLNEAGHKIGTNLVFEG